MERQFLIFGVFAILYSCTNFNKSLPEESTSYEADSIYLTKGKELVALTFDTLSKSLQNAISQFGVEGAVEFCNVEALKITFIFGDDNFSIKRTALKYRNPSNAPSDGETEILKSYLQDLQTGIEPKPRIKSFGNMVHFYAPILMKPQCVLCHGSENMIPENVSSKIKALYPNDLAIGFEPGELRGMWSIEFVK